MNGLHTELSTATLLEILSPSAVHKIVDYILVVFYAPANTRSVELCTLIDQGGYLLENNSLGTGCQVLREKSCTSSIRHAGVKKTVDNPGICSKGDFTHASVDIMLPAPV